MVSYKCGSPVFRTKSFVLCSLYEILRKLRQFLSNARILLSGWREDSTFSISKIYGIAENAQYIYLSIVQSVCVCTAENRTRSCVHEYVAVTYKLHEVHWVTDTSQYV